MRISCDETDSGFKTWLAHGGGNAKWRVTLNGVELRSCITADEELGEVLVFLYDYEGRIKIDKSGGEGNWKTVTRWLRGTVVISRQELAPAASGE